MSVRFVLCAIVLTAMSTLPAAALAYVGPAPSACTWHVFKSVNPRNDANVLNSVSATAAKDAWAVGDYFDTNTNAFVGLTEHWNGTKWSSVAPQPQYDDGFFGVTALSARDAWAVGQFYNRSKAQFQTLAEHWNGTKWSVIPTPNIGTDNQLLYSVSASSTKDVWAVGWHTLNTNVRATLTEHWNGSKWSIVPSPNMGTVDNALIAVAAISPNTVWADGGFNGPTYRTLTQRWNGNQWKIVPSPNVNANSNPFNAIAAVSANDVWGLGDYSTGTAFNSLAEHWNGTSWSIIPSANLGSQTALTGGAAVNKNDVWAVGEWVNGSVLNPFSMNWNGSAWKALAAPSVGTFGSLFAGASRIPGTTDVWGVGVDLNSSGQNHQTLIEKLHCG